MRCPGKFCSTLHKKTRANYSRCGRRTNACAHLQTSIVENFLQELVYCMPSQEIHMYMQVDNFSMAFNFASCNSGIATVDELSRYSIGTQFMEMESVVAWACTNLLPGLAQQLL